MMLSRIAESLFWLGRFVERAEGISISLQVQHSASLEADLYGFNNWEPILNAVGQLSPFYKVHKEASSDNVIDFLIFSPENPNSILECINRARENARGVRDMISKESWEIMNVTYHELNKFNMDLVRKEGPDKLFNFIRQRSYLFEGATEITMFRGKGYHFMRAGKYLERADQIARILDVKYHIPLPRVEDVGNPLDIYQWKTLLDSTGAYEAYLQHYNIKITPIQIAELLIFNPQLPRSLLFCMERALQSFRHISTVREKFFANKAEQKMGKLYYQIAYSNADEIFYFGLHEYLTNFINDLIDIGDEINHTYFGYV
ncbi:MAG TPA: alpha-E domain-containing protein [Leptospiraceae bacterium]|jgi:uncharacterized alpha-E superfamily protein|nr:alpha-E domain-containing protein [Leptospiraceae bacterium]MBK7056177.1 alpha-E domain-containing protein [Leptospiraceae bacterium]MBK9498597.1 alpha-E domain-containing protein [Leptospiraceae bacterium]HRG46493.1 alpha-E domain-containing protein [Leptospiraceae bacterium]HRG75158.1 alpha-E domain-containing protein [Leptospiraceae bacterium]